MATYEVIPFERHAVLGEDNSSVADLLRALADRVEELESRTDGQVAAIEVVPLNSPVRWAAATFRLGQPDDDDSVAIDGT